MGAPDYLRDTAQTRRSPRGGASERLPESVSQEQVLSDCTAREMEYQAFGLNGRAAPAGPSMGLKSDRGDNVIPPPEAPEEPLPKMRNR